MGNRVSIGLGWRYWNELYIALTGTVYTPCRTGTGYRANCISHNDHQLSNCWWLQSTKFHGVGKTKKSRCCTPHVLSISLLQPAWLGVAILRNNRRRMHHASITGVSVAWLACSRKKQTCCDPLPARTCSCSLAFVCILTYWWTEIRDNASGKWEMV